MKTRKEVKDLMTAEYIKHSVIQEAYGLIPGKTFTEQFSLVSIENILFDVISYPIWLLIQFFSKHESDIDQKIMQQKTGRLSWYQYMMLNYQDGFELLPESDQFDNTNASEEVIQNSKKIKHCAVTNGEEHSVIIIKIATEDSDGLLKPATNDVKIGAQSYVNRFGWAGNEFRVINNEPDLLTPYYDIYIDPTVIDENGVSKLDGSKPVEKAIAEFMKELPFNGELIIQHLTDKIQLVKGVKIAHQKAVYSSWISIDGSANQYNQPSLINVKRVPESGYFRIESFTNINYVV